MSVQIGRLVVLAEGEVGDGVHLVPYTNGSDFPWWSESTRAVLEALQASDVADKRVLDFGCGGHALLGLCAAWQGAAEVRYAEHMPELWAIAVTQIEANGYEALRDDGGEYDFALANLGDAALVGEVSRRATHGLGTDRDSQLIRW